MKSYSSIILLFFTLALFNACFEDDVQIQEFSEQEWAIIQETLDIPENSYDYNVDIPQHLNHGNIPHKAQEISHNRKATLGRVLFYDTKLSINEEVSCASCHDQKLAFSDNKALSQGFNGEFTPRNSLALANTPGFESSYQGGFEPAFFSWDESNHTLEEQSLSAITNKIEMGHSMPQLSRQLNEIPHYKVLFEKAYGPGNIQDWQITASLRSFVNSISSVNSKFDTGLKETSHFDAFKDFNNFTAEENFGKSLFNEKCSGCHDLMHSTVIRSKANNGLDLVYEDEGHYLVSGQPSDIGVFKIPFLRNVAMTAPYMHDGRFESLAEVIEHYSSGIQNHENLDEQLQSFREDDKARRFDFTSEEKQALVAYLHTLTDPELMEDVRFSDPFK